MKTTALKKFLLSSTLLSACFALPATGAVLAPDDASIAPNLQLWLGDASSTFDPATGVWADSSGNGRDATAVGEVNVNGSVTYSSGTLNGSAVAFSGAANDLMVTTNLNGGAGLSELTLFTVYNLTNVVGNPNLTRPAGIGSIAATQANPGNHFNLANDPSVRLDNGNRGAGQYSEGAILGASFIRVSRMSVSADSIDEWFNTGASLNPVLSIAGAYTTSNDDFYLGDLRAGVDAVPGWGATTSVSDFEISQVIVYNSALTNDQIAGVNEWVATSIPEPSSGILLALSSAMLFFYRRR